ncbi:SAV_2336 N-terminal domain-related protein [Streptomyces sp. NPDC048507]|uniref:SAV_2336 N-terminal domain-related protein n=1 Tax=Streptomyces sp. NPDC048507 TaxID=3365560 RepID=UPI00371DFFF6
MIERLLAAFAEGAGEGAGPRTDVGAEELADILWLAARVDAAPSPRTPDGPAAAPGARRSGPPRPPSADGPAALRPAGAPPAAVRLFPAPATAATVTAAAPGSAADAGGRRGVPLRLPRTASLDDPLALMRSLRPVGRRSIGGPGAELDEQLTVERSIEHMVPTPVLRPAESRWLDLALVVDTHHSMLLWSDLVAELRGILTRSGVFRDVRTWRLTGTGPGRTPMLARGRGGPPRNPLELADPAGRRLILVVSDTVADGWQQAPLRGVLRHWSGHNAVAVLNVLPERLWTRGAVRPVPFAVRSDRPAAATRSWQRVPAARRARGGGPVVPVVGIASGSLARLVRVVSGDGRWRRLACLRLDAAPAAPAAQPPGDLGALEAVERFRAAASPTAQQLAAHLAAVPLTLPVMTLVRRSLLPGSGHGHLAEVALGGLFAPWDGEQEPDDTEFDFLPGVRDVLLGSQLRGDVAAVRELVRRRVWEYLARHRGTGPDFSATRVTDGTGGRRHVPARARPFAQRPAPADVPPQRPDAGPRPGADAPRTAGLAHRVVRVRFEPSAEPGEAATLLGPRLVLTAGHVARPRDTVAWVRSGGREIACRPLWWDDATPRVFLLESDEDLGDPVGLPPLEWAEAEGRVVVDGVTDQGEPVALTARVVADEGARNGELLRLSAEPEDWTHYRGGPVSRYGLLAGVVHGVWPERMVFLSGAALLADEGFRGALDAAVRPLSGAREPDPRVALTVRADEAVTPHASHPRRALTELLTTAMGDAGVTGEVSAGPEPEETVTVVLDAPAALARAGRLLTELPRVLARADADGAAGAGPPLAVALDLHEVHPLPGRRSADPLAHALVRTRLRETRPPERIVLVLAPHLHERLAELLGPYALGDAEPLDDGGAGWLHRGGPVELADLVTRAEEARGESDDWHRCGRSASPQRPSGCAGVRIPGHSLCLAHLPPAALTAHLDTLGPGSPVDLRGTTFEDGLLERLLSALRDPGTGRVRLGRAAFTGAVFRDAWEAQGAEFEGDADFARAVFTAEVRFGQADFRGGASFRRAVFEHRAGFSDCRFARTADFGHAVFRREAEFTSARWQGTVSFRHAVAEGPVQLAASHAREEADFTGMLFRGHAELGAAVFSRPVSFAHTVWEGELSAVGTRLREPVFAHTVCRGPVVFASAVFEGRTTFEHVVFASEVDFSSCDFYDPVLFDHTVFEAPATFRECGFRAGISFGHGVFHGGFHWRLSRVEGGAAAFNGAVFEGWAYFEDALFAAGTSLEGAAFHGAVRVEAGVFGEFLDLGDATFDSEVEFIGTTLVRPPGLPPAWSATQSQGVWRISAPRPEEPYD